MFNLIYFTGQESNRQLIGFEEPLNFMQWMVFFTSCTHFPRKRCRVLASFQSKHPRIFLGKLCTPSKNLLLSSQKFSVKLVYISFMLSRKHIFQLRHLLCQDQKITCNRHSGTLRLLKALKLVEGNQWRKLVFILARFNQAVKGGGECLIVGCF